MRQERGGQGGDEALGRRLAVHELAVGAVRLGLLFGPRVGGGPGVAYEVQDAQVYAGDHPEGVAVGGFLGGIDDHAAAGDGADGPVEASRVVQELAEAVLYLLPAAH